MLLEDTPGHAFEVLLATLEQLAEYGGSEHLGRDIEARRDGGKLAFLRRREIDGELHGWNLPSEAILGNPA